MTARHVAKGRPVHDAEQRGIQALVRALPDNYVVYSNIELASDRAGQTFEHDAVVVAPHAIFTVELKSWGGRIVGNRDRWTLKDGTVVQSPIPLILAKARTLKGRLQSRRRDLANVWVQGLVFLSAADATARITPDYESLVANTDEIRQALTDPTWLGHPPPILPTQRRVIEEFLEDGRPTRAQEQLDDFRLVQRLPSEDRPFEAWLAERSVLGRERRVLHAYTIVGETEAERERLRAHALREATLHNKLRGGPDILWYETYFVTRDDPQRIVLQFEDTTPLQPVDAWVKDRKPSLHARLVVATRVARALAWVHERGLVHRRLSPDAVLVSSEDHPTQVRLCAFELARDLTGAAPTITGSSLGDPTFRCTAPEVLRTAEATARSDLFSLGATLVEILTGRPMFANVDEVLQPFTVPPLHVADRPCPRGIADLVHALLEVQPSQRPKDALDVAERLSASLGELTRIPVRSEIKKDLIVRDTYEIIGRLGRGATATTWHARQLQTDREVVLKIADADHAHYLQEEGRVLAAVHHPNLVHFYNVEPYEQGNLLVLEYVAGHTAALWAAAGDPLDPKRFLSVADGLLGALGALHQAGWVHRDVKPDNVMLDEDGSSAKLLDVGLACRHPFAGDLAVGSIHYKDPLVYVANRWAPTNDLFSAFLVLYEVLTGTHAYGGAAPEPNQIATIQAEEFPDGWPAEVIERVVAVFRGALSPTTSDRPVSADEARQRLRVAIGGTEAAKPSHPVRPAPVIELLPADVRPDTLLSDLDLPARTQGALFRLGFSVVADVIGLDVQAVRALPNVGEKTVRSLRALAEAAAARFPDLPVAERQPPERFYPALADDVRPLDELGRDLPDPARQALRERGVFTVGQLAAMPPTSLGRLPFIGPTRVERLRKAMRRLAGREPAPENLAELDALLAEEVGERGWAALSLVLGLKDGVLRSQSEAAGLLGVTRQRVSQLLDLDPLRKEASWAHHLVAVVTELLPPPGFASLEWVASGLAERLPTSDAGPSARGFARLAALLLRPDARAAEGADVSLVFRSPWTEARISALHSHLDDCCDWPPLPRAEVEVRLWDRTDADLQRSLVRWGADAGLLLDAALRENDSVVVDRLGGLYTPPVDLSKALELLRPSLVPAIQTATLLAEVQTALQGVILPVLPEEVDASIERAGYHRDGDRWVDPDRVELPDTFVSPRVDPTIPTQRVGADVPPLVDSLAAQADRGGFRVVALPPPAHHRLARDLSGWLVRRLGADRVSFVPVDRVIIDALKASDLWKFVPYLERGPDADWRMFRAELSAAMDRAVDSAAPGRVTVLGQPSLLGTLGLMDWLSGFYERARGGRHGLVVLAVPGGIHEDRVRLNEKYNLPYTPDMAAVYLDDKRGAA